MSEQQASENTLIRFNLLKEFALVAIGILTIIVGALAAVAVFAYDLGKEQAATEAQLREAGQPNEVRELQIKLAEAVAQKNTYKKDADQKDNAIKLQDEQLNLKEKQLAEWVEAYNSLKPKVDELANAYKSAKNDRFLQERIIDTEDTIAELWRDKGNTNIESYLVRIDEMITSYENRLARYQNQIVVCESNFIKK